MFHLCLKYVLLLYFVSIFLLLAKGITELSFQMGTDHLFYEVDRPLLCIYATFLFHLRCIYVSFMFHLCRWRWNRFVHFCRASPRWGLITSFRNLHRKAVILHLSFIYATFMLHFVSFMFHLCRCSWNRFVLFAALHPDGDWSSASEICTKKPLSCKACSVAKVEPQKWPEIAFSWFSLRGRGRASFDKLLLSDLFQR